MINKDKNLQDEYYLLIEPEERKKYLEKIMNDGTVSDDIQRKAELFGMRYEVQRQKNKTEYIDRFLRLWMDLSIEAGNTLSGSRKKKEYDKVCLRIRQLGVPAFREQGTLAIQTLYDEMRHLVRTYIYASLNSKSYTRYFDLVPVPKDRIDAKLNNDIERVLIEYAETIGLDQIFPEMISAAKDELEYYNSRQKGTARLF